MCRFVYLFLLLVFPVAAIGQIDLTECTVQTRADQDVSILMCPDSGTIPLAQARAFGGAVVDATIEIILRDGGGFPVSNIPQIDLWLWSPDLEFWNGANYADFNTNSLGYTEFAGTLRGGGCMESPSLYVGLYGQLMTQESLPHIRVNSPDMNADGIVNLADVWRFAEAYGDGSYSADFHWDGQLNLVDVSIFAQHVGHSSQ